MNNKTSEDIFNFPCEYPIKIFGKKCSTLESSICQIISKHSGKIHSKNISKRQSSKGNYVAITVLIIATSRSQIDTINQKLQDHLLVSYVL